MTTFISYSRANSEFAIRFARDLKSEGFGIWLDQLDIPKGSRWDDEVERALESSSTFIIVLAPESIESQNVKDEIGYAIDNGKHILPILLKPCKIPFRLRRFQFVDFTNEQYDEGLTEIKRLLSNTKELAIAMGDDEGSQKTDVQPSSKRSTDQGRSGLGPRGVNTEGPVAVKPHRKWDSQVIIALIGLAGTIFAALLGSPLFSGWFTGESAPTPVATATTGYDQTSNTPEVTIPIPSYSGSNVAYDFTYHICEASWYSDVGQLPCPGTEGDARGFVLIVSNPELENAAPDGRLGILTFPQSVRDGYIQGVFPPFEVQIGDIFRATIGCEGGATECDVTYQLDYQIGSNPIQTLLAPSRQRYTDQADDVDVILSSLAGRSVRFILTIHSDGSPRNDRALWIAPVIVGIRCKNLAQFVADVTVPDGTIFSPGEKFTKTVRLKNIGTCTWTNDYVLEFFSGEYMNGPPDTLLPVSVAPGQTVDISLDLQAPFTPGSYRGYWVLSDSSRSLFGIGPLGNKPPFWVDIKVAAKPTSTP